MGIDAIRLEIEHMRRQIIRQQKDIKSFQQVGIGSASAEAMLARMREKVDGLVTERDRLNGKERQKYPGTNKVIHGTPAQRRA
jgi:hypothetical protein